MKIPRPHNLWISRWLLLSLLLIWGDQAPFRGAMQSAGAAPDFTLYLPLIARFYDPGYTSPFGITMYGAVDDAWGLSKMKEAGGRWVVTVLSWSAVEPARGSFNWAGFDEKVRNAQGAGMEVFVLFTDNPSWAAALPGGPVTNTQDLVDFVTRMAERYDCDGVEDAPGSPCVHYWSFYAEPDNGDLDRARYGKGYWGHNGAGFAAMLAQISPAIHTANPRAKVLIGGLAYDWFEEEGGPFVRSFLTDTLRALNALGGGEGQARRFIDAVAFHYYPISPHRWPTLREKAMEIRGIMERHGISDLPLLVPEMGFWSDPSVGSSEELQARWLAQMLVRGLSVDLRMLAWYSVFDAGPGTEAHGLFWDRDLNRPKLSYWAYQTLTRELQGARYLHPLDIPGVEAYVFRMPDGVEKTVLWARGSNTTVDFPYPCLRLVDTVGRVYDPVRDGDPNWDGDRTANGQIRLGIYVDQPFYVMPRPCP
ncbi:beta-galactosidase [Thermoflexus sp.]|uniref:beta-galactosidase n=1 Tax=Thermoflexus sp. TaxID=1969742 RepID=UPI0035E45515